MDSSSEKAVVTDLVRVLVGGSLFCKPTELFCALECDKNTEKEHLELITFVANKIYPPKHIVKEKKEILKLSLSYAKAWVDRLTEPINNETKITYSDLVERVEAVMTSPYLSKELLLPDHKKGKVGVFWNFMLCPIPKDFDYGKIFKIILDRLVKRGHCNGIEIFAFGDQTCLSGDEKVSKAIAASLSAQSVKIIHFPKADKDKHIKEVADKQIIIKMMDWAFEYQRFHKEPGTVVAITSDLNFRYCIQEIKTKYGFDVLLAHAKDARWELIRSASISTVWDQMITE